jgi:hypothetical protein
MLQKHNRPILKREETQIHFRLLLTVLNRNAMLKFRKTHWGQGINFSIRAYLLDRIESAESKYGNLNNFSTNADATGSTF